MGRSADLHQLMADLYPDPEDYRDHPMTAAGVVLLTAATLETTAIDALVRFTNHSPAFVSAVSKNMQLNGLWVEGQYNCSGWLSSDGSVAPRELWDHICIGLGEMWMPGVNDTSGVDASSCYYRNKTQ